MKTYFKLAVLLMFVIASSTRVFSQQFYYSGKKKNILVEDTTTLIIKIKEDKEMTSLFARLPLGLIQSFDTSKLKGVVSLKLKQNAKRKDLLSLLKGLNNINYSWHSLQLSNTFIIPTGEILLQPKKGVALKTILSKTSMSDNVQFKNIDKYGVITLNILNDDSLFVTANTIYESGFVEWCHPNFWFPIKHTTNDPLYVDQWYLKNTGQFSGTSGIDINIENVWAFTTGSSSIKIAVIDDGVEDHEDMSGRVLSGYTPRNISTGLGLPTSSGKHGEACAGIIAATQNNSTGIVGIAPNCKIVPVNIFYDNNETTSDLANAINWSWDNGQADILSNSWGYGQGTPSGFDNIVQAITNARTYGRGGKGSVVVFSSGNDYSNVSFPANVDGVITVGAIDNNGSLFSYSNTGASIDLVAPSGSPVAPPFTLSNPYDGIRTIDRMGSNGYNSDNYTSFNGTSASCPQVSGVAALMLSVAPNLTETQVANILHASAIDMGASGFDNSYGYGRINAASAVCSAFTQGLSISGNNIVCNSEIYSLSGAPSSASITWSAYPNILSLSPTTGPSTTATKTGNGVVTLTASVSNFCTGIVYPISKQKQISVGAPTIQGWYNSPTNSSEPLKPFIRFQTNYNDACYLQYITTNMQVSPGATVLWETPSLSSASIPWSQTGNNLRFYFTDVNQWGIFPITATNACGTTNLRYRFQSSNGCAGTLSLRNIQPGTAMDESPGKFAVFPNPAKNLLYVTIPADSIDMAHTQIHLMDFSGKTLQSIKKVNNLNSFNMSGFASGMYLIEITDKNKRIIKKIIKY